MPVYIRYIAILFGIVLLVYVLIVSKDITAPLAIAYLLSLFLQPVSRKLEDAGLNRGLAALASLLLGLFILAFIGISLSLALRGIAQNLPEIREQLLSRITGFQQFIQETWGISPESQIQYLRQIGENLIENSSLFIQRTISGTYNVFTGFIITPIAIYFFLSYRNFYKKFILMAASETHREQAVDILNRVQDIVQKYFTGLLIVMAIIATLNTLGLYIIGIRYAFFWGILAALLTIIPFIGIIIGSLFPILFSLFTMDSLWYPVAIAAWFWVVQWLEGDFITPKIVGSRVELNPFAALLALLIGAEIWGAIGMIVSIPFLAILKILFDSIPTMKPYGYLLGIPERLENPYLRQLWEKIRNRSKKKKK